MPPLAVGLAVLLHVVIAAGVWWLSPLQAREAADEPIMVSFDSSPSDIGQQLLERQGPPPESVEAGAPPADPPRDVQQALAAPPAQAAPQREVRLPIYEFSIPVVPEPPPAPTARDFSPPPTTAPRQVQRPLPLPPRPAPPAQHRPAAEAPASTPAPFLGPDPADSLAGAGRQRNDYMTRVFRHLEPHRVRTHNARAPNQHGRVVTRVTLARDGGLLGVSIDSSSGRPALDAAEIEAIRSAAPFPAIPANMPGDPVILILRMTY